MENIARFLVIGGIVLILIGGGVYLAAKFGIPLGTIARGYSYRRGEWLVLFPDHEFDFGFGGTNDCIKFNRYDS